jgi:DNA-binding IscR family transcriptional regulator
MIKYTRQETKDCLKLKAWLKAHPLISILALEKKSEVAKNTISNSLNSERLIPPKHIQKIMSVLKDYGLVWDETQK